MKLMEILHDIWPLKQQTQTQPVWVGTEKLEDKKKEADFQ